MTRHAIMPLSLLSFALFAQTPAQTPADPWQPSDLMQPAALAGRLAGSEPKPKILYVGFPILYKSSHIPGAVLAGPASKPEGLQRLKQIAAKLPRDRELIIYCGCCPWDQCPNVRPAFRALHKMGFKHLKLVTIPTNMSTDWIAKDYPVERGASKSE